MNYLTSKEIDNQEFISLFGKLIEMTEIDESWGRKNSYILYISGIPNFDEFMEGVKFSNTNLQHHLLLYEKGIGFMLAGKSDNILFNILKTDIESIVAYHEQQIEICDVNQALNIMKTGMAGQSGLASVLVTKAAGHIGDAILKKFKPVNSKTIKGSIYEIRTKQINGESYTIKVSCRDENKYDVNKLLDKYLNFGITKNDPKTNCYIATVCYQNPFSSEVIAFKRFRDESLCKSMIGRFIILTYYKFSPKLSRILYKKVTINKIIKIAFLNPIYKVIK